MHMFILHPLLGLRIVSADPHLTPHWRLAGFSSVLRIYSHRILEQELAFQDCEVFPLLKDKIKVPRNNADINI